MAPKVQLIVAACENMGIGNQGTLPWKLKNELSHFSRMTKSTVDPEKKNVVLMGRKTWNSIPVKFRPLPGRINIVLTRQNLILDDKDVHVCKSFEGALDLIKQPPLCDQVEIVWVIGGTSVYEHAMKSSLCHRVYMTKIFHAFECDAFFPTLDENKYIPVSDPGVSTELQEENGITYKYEVFENIAAA